MKGGQMKTQSQK